MGNSPSVRSRWLGLRTIFYLLDAARIIPSGQDSAILPARVANIQHSVEFGSSCPLAEQDMIS